MLSSSFTAQMFSSGLMSACADWLRGKVAKRGDDPRLVQDVSAQLLMPDDEVLITVKLRDGRRGEARATMDEAQSPAGFMTRAMYACGHAFAKQAAVEFAPDGLASDGWWRSAGVATAAAARRWVRVLLNDPHMTDAHVDRFIASLDPPKREDLLKRAVEGAGIGGF
jgi:hypothetical protein